MARREVAQESVCCVEVRQCHEVHHACFVREIDNHRIFIPAVKPQSCLEIHSRHARRRLLPPYGVTDFHPAAGRSRERRQADARPSHCLADTVDRGYPQNSSFELQISIKM
jgi:hypothetical protein